MPHPHNPIPAPVRPSRSAAEPSARDPKSAAVADRRPATMHLAQLATDRGPALLAPNRTGLPDGLKSGVEQLGRCSLDDVRVHRNSPKPAQLQAHAYAQGNEIHVAPGQEKHLGHEAWHVVQQKQGRVRPTTRIAGVAVNDDQALEREADTMAARAVRQPAERASRMGARLDAPTEKTGTPPFAIGRPAQAVEVHPAGCACGACGSGGLATGPTPVASPTQAVFQLTCDLGHKHHKNGPCPSTPAGRVARMASKHHPKTGVKGTPKERLEERKERNLKNFGDPSRRDKQGGGPGGAGGAGGAGGTVASG